MTTNADDRTFQLVSCEQLVPSPYNPRKDPGDLTNLAASIKSAGVLEPLLVRPTLDTGFEVVAGSRRLRAAQLAGLSTVPCLVQALTDGEALEIQIIENEQRADVHPLDQAEGLSRLQQLDPALYTVDILASRIGLSASSVWQRLKLLDLIPELKSQFRANKFTASHAILLARLAAADQKRVLPHLYDHYEKDVVLSVRALQVWIDRNVKLDLLNAALPADHPELAKQLTTLRADGVDPLVITTLYGVDNPAQLKKDGILARGDWVPVGKKKCKHTRPAVVVLGEDRTDVLQVCAEKACRTHWPHYNPPKPKAVSAAEQQKATKAAARERQEKARAKAKVAIRETVFKFVLRAFVGKVTTLKPAALRVLAEVCWDAMPAHPVVRDALQVTKRTDLRALTPAKLTALLVASFAGEDEWGFTQRSSKDTALERLAAAYGISIPKLEAAAGKSAAAKKPKARAA